MTRPDHHLVRENDYAFLLHKRIHLSFIDYSQKKSRIILTDIILYVYILFNIDFILNHIQKQIIILTGNSWYLDISWQYLYKYS